MYEWLTKGTEGDEGWKCSPLEWLGREPVRYLGMDVRRKEVTSVTSFPISQGSYVTELLRNYPEEAARPSHVPASKEVMPQSEDGDDAELVPVDDDLVKQAQKMAGELLWLVTRTRPDVGFATAHVCSAATKDLAAASRLAKMTMGYLAWVYAMMGKVVRCPVVANSDASFAPHGDRSFGCVTTATYGGFAAWRMTKPPAIALSCPLLKLVELLNASQQAAGLQAWVNEVSSEDTDEPLVLRVDNTAACGLATTSPGSWKTLHLKVKARHLRMETSEGRIQVIHTPCEVQVADMGTKPVPVSRLQDLKKLWGMCSAEDFENDEKEVVIRSLRGADYYDLLRMFAWLMMVSKVPKGEAAEIYSKKPLDYDGNFEVYGMLLIAGVALLGVWETLKWIAHKLFGDDEATIAKAHRLMRIRNQASKALQEELVGPARATGLNSRRKLSAYYTSYCQRGYVTGDDCPDNDPTAFELHGSQDGVYWEFLDSRMMADRPPASWRPAQTEWFTFKNCTPTTTATTLTQTTRTTSSSTVSRTFTVSTTISQTSTASTTTSPEGAFVQLIESGTCAQLSLFPILGPAECEQAARQLDLPDLSAQITAEAERPEGCYFFEGLSLWLGVSPASKGRGAETSGPEANKTRHPICSSVLPDMRVATGLAGKQGPRLRLGVVARCTCKKCMYSLYDLYVYKYTGSGVGTSVAPPMVCPPPLIPTVDAFLELAQNGAPAMMAITLRTMMLVCFFNTGIPSVTLGSITALVLFCMLTGIMITIFGRGPGGNPHHREP
ncbi:unnamed protein product [Symbiodinium sp. CCMP2592]|nr:unnamed protein product [Symbiodinium sp. CCMP2592]